MRFEFKTVKNKIFAYSVLGFNVIATWVSWWVLAGSIFGRGRHIWLYPILAFSFWGIMFTLSVIFVKNRKLIYASFIAGAVAYPIFFGPSLSISGAAIAVLLFIFTENRTKKEIARGIKVDFYHLVSHSLKYFVSAVCLVAAIAYYFSVTERQVPSAVLIENKTLATEMDWGLKAAGFVLPEDKKELIDDITNNVSVDDFLSKNFVKPELADNIASGNDIATNNPTDTAKLIGGAATLEIQQAMLDKSKKDLAKQLGVDVVGERPMKEVLMAYIDKTERSFFEYSGSDKFYVPAILALGIFLTARILGTAVDIFLGLVILLIIKLLRTFGVVQVSREEREVTFIEYNI